MKTNLLRIIPTLQQNKVYRFHFQQMKCWSNDRPLRVVV